MNEDQKCAPSKIYNKQIGTCFSHDQLILMANAYNTYIDNNNINKPKIDLNSSTKELLIELTKSLSKTCNQQTCLLQEVFVKEIKDSKLLFELLYNSYRPKGPFKGQDKNKWLSTSDINQILFQYQTITPDFIYLGALPIDFESINVPINIKDIKLYYWLIKFIKAKIYKMGYVLNLSKHNESGSHWVGLFINLKKNQIYYFDSCGDPPPSQIIHLMNRIAAFCYYINIKKNPNIKKITNRRSLEEFDKVDMRYNNTIHQRGNSECGIYATNFIINMINNVSFTKFTSTVITDSQINKLRNVYFRYK
jgi:hypothetical protein